MASKKKKTSAGKIVLFVAEILILVALLVVMWLVLKTTDKEEGVQKVSIDEKEIEVSLPDEVKENESVLIQKPVYYPFFNTIIMKTMHTWKCRFFFTNFKI